MLHTTHDQLADEIVTQIGLLTSTIKGADLTVPVPSCPGWNVGQLLRHLGGAHQWVDEIVRTRADERPDDEFFRDLSAYANEDPDVVGPWLTDGAARLAETLKAAGPGAQVWNYPFLGGDASFYSRRMAHETVMHRADATLALGAEYILDAEVALDSVDEWMHLGSLPAMLEFQPEKRELLGHGHTLHFHATDTAPELTAEWLVDLTGDNLAWRRAHEKATVAVRAPLTDLLLIIYRRKTVEQADAEVLGDKAVFDNWLEMVSFG
jgi:uncharacterized protein (TIGR03083 family)